MCNYADDNALYTYSRDFHQVQEYLKKDFEILENWFYDNYMVLNPRKCEFMGFGKTNENEVFTYHEIRLKKTTPKKLLGITIDEHLSFNEHLTNVCKRASRKLNALSRVSSFLSYQHKKVIANSFISGQFNYCPLIWMFSSIRSYRKINKLHERSLRLCHNDYTSSYDELLSKQDLVNIHVRNIQQLMIEIFKCLKGISPPIMNDIFRLRNIPYTIRNLRDLDSWLPKTVYCGLETLAYKGPQLWQQLPAKIKKSSSLVSFKHNIKQ